jgi:hypothetical protein
VRAVTASASSDLLSQSEKPEHRRECTHGSFESQFGVLFRDTTPDRGIRDELFIVTRSGRFRFPRLPIRQKHADRLRMWGAPDKAEEHRWDRSDIVRGLPLASHVPVVAQKREAQSTLCGLHFAYVNPLSTFPPNPSPIPLPSEESGVQVEGQIAAVRGAQQAR